MAWESLDKGALSLIVASMVEGIEHQHQRIWFRSSVFGPPRLVCRQWAVEFAQECTLLKVKGKGSTGWERRFCGLDYLDWYRPETVLANPGQCWPKLESLLLRHCADVDLQMLRDMTALEHLPRP